MSSELPPLKSLNENYKNWQFHLPRGLTPASMETWIYKTQPAAEPSATCVHMSFVESGTVQGTNTMRPQPSQSCQHCCQCHDAWQAKLGIHCGMVLKGRVKNAPVL